MPTPRARVLLLDRDDALGYRPALAAILAEDEIVADGVPAWTGDFDESLDGALALIRSREPDILVFDCPPQGFAARDIRRGDAIPLFEFEHQLRSLGAAFQRECGRQTVFVTTPPIDAARVPDNEDLARQTRSSAHFAIAFMRAVDIMTADLHGGMAPHADEWLDGDGITLSSAGREGAARIVARAVLGVMHS